MNECAFMNDEYEYFLTLKGKFIVIIVDVNNYKYKLSGKVINVLENKLIIDDVKTGEAAIQFKDLSVLEVKDA